MNVKLKVLTAGVLFFTGQALVAQEVKKDSDSGKEKQIDEVVLVGFGRKVAVKEATGSIGKVGGQDIANVASASVDKAFSGKVAGVQGGMSTGQPGGAADLRIRGVASINGRNNPIYIIDGVRVAQGDLTSNTTSANILANFNEADIESVTVLKDAVSTAVYGADAGTGVVIITTKSGRKGKARFSFNNEMGVAYRAVRGEETLSTDEWLGLLYAGYRNRFPTYTSNDALISALNSKTLGQNGDVLQSIYDSRSINTDWRKESEKTGGAYFHKLNFSVSGGNDKLTYFSSIGYLDQNGVVKNTGFNRISNTNKINYKATDKLTIATDLQLSYGKTQTVGQETQFANPVFGAYFLRPTDPVRNENGSYYLGGSNGRLSNNLFNVVALQDLNYMTAKTARVFANLQVDYSILKNLKYKFVFAPELINIEEDNYSSPLHGDGRNLNGYAISYASRYFNFNVQNILSYDFRIGDRNNFSASLIQEAYRSDRRTIGGRGDVVGTSRLETLNNLVIPRTAYGVRSIDSRGGYAVTLHYDYDKLVLLDVSGRQDRLSNFWADNKTGYFWSAGVGVDLARLEALKDNNTISQLKFSASYGKVGNLANVSPYATYVYTINYNDLAAAYPSGVDNKDLKWETLSPFNAGFDLGLFNNRLNLGVAYFHKITKDMIFDIPLSPAQGAYTGSSGNPTKYINIGEMKNAGFEFTVDAKIIKNAGNGFNWDMGVNLSTLNNSITKLYGGKEIVLSETRTLREGEAANAFYLRKWAGVDPTNGNPLWYKNGVDGETTSNYNEAQRAVQGSPLSTLYGGVTTKLSYKGFSLDAQLSFGFGNKVYDSYAYLVQSDGLRTHLYPGYKSQLDYWTPENPNALNPKPIYRKGNNSAHQPSTRYLYKGDYMRLRTLKLAYNIKSELLERTGLRGLQIYLLGDNIWTHNFDKNFKYDPDLQVNGYVTFQIPPMKTYSLGVNINF